MSVPVHRSADSVTTSSGFKGSGRIVAAPGFQAPGVVVSYTDDPEMQSGKAFLSRGLQSASGVPLMCDEGSDFRTFRLGLFGLEKLGQTARALAPLEDVLRSIAASRVTTEPVRRTA